MSLLGALLGAATKTPGRPLSDPVVAEWFAGVASQTAAGIAVTPESALRMGVVYACVSLVAETIGSLPTHMLREDGRFRRPVNQHPLEVTLTERANPEMEAGEFWEQIVGWMLCRGNGLAWIDTTDRQTYLWPVPWNRVRVLRTRSDHLAYRVRLAKGERVGALEPETDVILLADEVLHYRNFGLGPIGLSPIAQAAEAIGLAEAAQEYGARLFSQDARPGGYLKSPTKMEDEEFDKMRERWNKLHQGTKRSHMIGILEGLDWVKVGISPEEAQFLELRKFQVADLARWFRVPLYKIQVNEPGAVSYASTEMQGIDFVVYTLRSRITRLERVTRMRLLAREPGVFHRFNVNGLLRGDTKARYEAYGIGRLNGFLSVNDIRSLEDMEPIEGGDTYLQALNMAPVASTGNGRVRELAAAVTPRSSFEPDGT